MGFDKTRGKLFVWNKYMYVEQFWIPSVMEKCSSCGGTRKQRAKGGFIHTGDNEIVKTKTELCVLPELRTHMAIARIVGWQEPHISCG